MEIQIQVKPREKRLLIQQLFFFFHITEIDFGKRPLQVVQF